MRLELAISGKEVVKKLMGDWVPAVQVVAVVVWDMICVWGGFGMLIWRF
jgi:hypothetical protein